MNIPTVNNIPSNSNTVLGQILRRVELDYQPGPIEREIKQTYLSKATCRTVDPQNPNSFSSSGLTYMKYLDCPAFLKMGTGNDSNVNNAPCKPQLVVIINRMYRMNEMFDENNIDKSCTVVKTKSLVGSDGLIRFPCLSFVSRVWGQIPGYRIQSTDVDIGEEVYTRRIIHLDLEDSTMDSLTREQCNDSSSSNDTAKRREEGIKLITRNIKNSKKVMCEKTAKKPTAQKKTHVREKVPFFIDHYSYDILMEFGRDNCYPLVLEGDRRVPPEFKTVAGIILTPSGPPPWDPVSFKVYFDKVARLLDMRIALRRKFGDYVASIEKRVVPCMSIFTDIAQHCSKNTTIATGAVTKEFYEQLKQYDNSFDIEQLLKRYYELDEKLRTQDLSPVDRTETTNEFKKLMTEIAKHGKLYLDHQRSRNIATEPITNVIHDMITDGNSAIVSEIADELKSKGIEKIQFVPVDRATMEQIETLPDNIEN